MLGKFRKKRDELIEQLRGDIKKRDTYIAELETALANRNTCVGIHRDGRMNKFTFIADGQLVEIETMGLLSDNVRAWRDQLGIKS